jgi:hypothetical protein
MRTRRAGCSTTTTGTTRLPVGAIRRVIQLGWRVGVFRRLGMWVGILSRTQTLKGYVCHVSSFGLQRHSAFQSKRLS